MKLGRDAFHRAADADYWRAFENAAGTFAIMAATEGCQDSLSGIVENRTPR
jgi:hypothetical protein